MNQDDVPGAQASGFVYPTEASPASIAAETDVPLPVVAVETTNAQPVVATTESNEMSESPTVTPAEGVSLTTPSISGSIVDNNHVNQQTEIPSNANTAITKPYSSTGRPVRTVKQLDAYDPKAMAELGVSLEGYIGSKRQKDQRS